MGISRFHTFGDFTISRMYTWFLYFLLKYHPGVPEDIYDPDWNGVDSVTDRICKCGLRPRRYVVCDRMRPTDTGRKFLACCHENTVCDFIECIDGEHESIMLQRSLSHLWCLIKKTEHLNGRAQDARREEICRKISAEKKKALREIKEECRRVVEKMVSVRLELNHAANEM